MTTRSGFMKSSMAAPCLRNSGLLTTLKVCVVWLATASRTFRAVPTGTVLLSTTIVYLFIARPISRATPSTCCRSAHPEAVLQAGGAVLALRRADGDEHDFRAADRGRQIGRERQAVFVNVPAD